MAQIHFPADQAPDRKLTETEFDEVCRDARRQGFGDSPRENPLDLPGIVVVGGAIAPAWMAEVFGRIAKRSE